MTALPIPPLLPFFLLPLQIGEDTPNVTIDSVFVLKNKEFGLVLGVKGGYYIAAIYKADPRSDTSVAVAEALGIGFYYAVGPDAA